MVQEIEAMMAREEDQSTLKDEQIQVSVMTADSPVQYSKEEVPSTGSAKQQQDQRLSGPSNLVNALSVFHSLNETDHEPVKA